MDRALRNVNDVAANTSNNQSGYPELSNIQLASEVQKLSGYNHFSSSTASLLEEVVRRLVCSQGVEAPFMSGHGSGGSLDPDDKPVSFGSTITFRDLKEAKATVSLDPAKHLKKSCYPDMEKQLLEQGIDPDSSGLMETLKRFYNITSICKQAPAGLHVKFYWLRNNSMYWTMVVPGNQVQKEE